MSARLSPAASLLRNSKLFALPPAIALPVAPPSSSEISHSETATTPFPRFAAIETTEASGRFGDWGFKRPLPAKTLRNTNNPVVRLVRGIDTAEHVADFESAADHVLTLRKFSELDHPIKLAKTDTFSKGATRDLNHSVFRASSDNTTNLSSTAPHYAANAGLYGEATSAAIQTQLPPKLQNTVNKPESTNALVSGGTRGTRVQEPPRRWRFKGPSLTSISGEQFNEYLKSLDDDVKACLHDRIREEVVRDKRTRSRDQGLVQESFNKEEVTEQEVQEHIRYLRGAPGVFGPIIAEVLDLPKVSPSERNDGRDSQDKAMWAYGPSTLASNAWATDGTPATHPSAGLSYSTGTHAINHPNYGPQAINNPVVARAVKKNARAPGNNGTRYGVAGFIAESTDRASYLGQKSFEKTDGGMKGAVVPKSMYIHSDGTLRMRVEESTLFSVLDDKAVPYMEYDEARRSANDTAPTQGRREVRPAPTFSGPSAIRRMDSASSQQRIRSGQEPPDIDAILGRSGRR